MSNARKSYVEKKTWQLYTLITCVSPSPGKTKHIARETIKNPKWLLFFCLHHTAVSKIIQIEIGFRLFLFKKCFSVHNLPIPTCNIYLAHKLLFVEQKSDKIKNLN